MPFRVDVTATPTLFEPWAREGVLADWGEVVATLTPKSGRISGRVLAAESGELLTGVALSWAVSAVGHIHTGVTRLEDGRLDVLAPAGEVRLEAAATGRERVGKEVPVSAGEWVQDVEFALPRLPQVSLSGRVLDETGVPVPGARLSLRTLVVQDLAGAKTTSLQDLGRLQSDVAGKFQYSNLTPGGHQLSVHADGFEPTGSIALEVAPEGAEVEIVLGRAGSLLLRAVDAEGRLLEPTRIVLWQAGKVAIEAKRQSGRLSVTRERRSFRAHGIVAARGEIGDHREGEMAGKYPDGGDVISGVPPGEYEVMIEAPPRSGESKVFVGAEGTIFVEVRCR
ncbi:MAG: carboxypeptidase regulatory-like domain-containing protein [Planctomycetota bacterium]